MKQKPVKQPKRRKDETLEEKVHRHLKDKNDIITEDDLKNVKVEPITKREEAKSEKFADELSKKKKITPWNILDEEE